MKKRKICSLSFFAAMFLIGSLWIGNSSDLTAAETSTAKSPVWLKEWQAPSNQMRPLQIVHGSKINDSKIQLFRDKCGLGGLVVNVPFANGYLRNENNWKEFVESVKKARQAGLRLWIYDEQGWPSLSAGGVVLEKDPSLEALEFVYEEGAKTPYYSRKSYEYTFASMDTLRTARRHPNPLDPKATQKFLEVTHQHYKDALGPDLYHQIEAFFTDEPTLLGISILRIMTPEERQKYGVTDPLDWTKKKLPAVPWRADLEDQYKKRYGEDLRPNFKSIFGGTSDKDRDIREKFWKMIGEINASSYFGEIRRFCQQDPKGPLASGHTLAEESFLLNVPLDGNKLEVLKEFQLPGQDLLTSAPFAQLSSNWLTSVFPASAAYLIGSRKVMTEISDHIQRHAKEPRIATLDEMRAAAGVMAANSITEFTLYYSIHGGKEFPWRNEKTHRQYCDFVGRINSILRDAQPVRPLLLYYPIEQIQREYVPMGGHFQHNSQTKRVAEVSWAFNTLGRSLTQSQIPFIIVDDQSIRELIANGAGKKNESRTIRSDFEFSGIIYPETVEKKNYSWNNKNLAEIYAKDIAGTTNADSVQKAVSKQAGPRLVLDPPNQKIALGAFVRDGQFVFTLTNTNDAQYTGKVSFNAPKSMSINDGKIRFSGEGKKFEFKGGAWTIWNPVTAEQKTLPGRTDTQSMTLDKYETLIITID